MSDIRRSFILSSITQYLNKILSFGFIVITARLLTPEELGLYAIATAIVVVATEFRLLGATNYLVRSEKINKAMVRSGLGLTICICWPMGALIILSSDWIANYYELNELEALFRILGIPFFFAPFISISACLLTRSLAFEKIMYISLSSLIVKVVSSLFLIWKGYSFYALAWGLVIATMFEFLLYALFRPALISWKPSFKGLKPIMSFGIFNTLINAFQRFEAAAPDVILGKFASTRDVAMYSRGAGFLTFVNEMVTAGVWQVALPAMSKINRDGGDVYEGYIKASLLLGGLVMPVLTVAAVAAYPVILLIFGEQWAEAVPVAQIVVGWVILKSIHTLSIPLLISTGHEKPLLIKQISVFSVCIIAGVLAAQTSLLHMAAAMVLVGLADLAFSSVLLQVYAKINALSFFKRIIPNFIVSLLCGCFTFVLDILISFQQTAPFTSFVIVATSLPFVWIMSIYITKHPLKNEIELLSSNLWARLK